MTFLLKYEDAVLTVSLCCGRRRIKYMQVRSQRVWHSASLLSTTVFCYPLRCGSLYTVLVTKQGTGFGTPALSVHVLIKFSDVTGNLITASIGASLSFVQRRKIPP